MIAIIEFNKKLNNNVRYIDTFKITGKKVV